MNFYKSLIIYILFVNKTAFYIDKQNQRWDNEFSIETNKKYDV